MFMAMNTWSSPTMFVLDESEHGTVYCIANHVVFETDSGLVQLRSVDSRYYGCNNYLETKKAWDKNSKDKND